MLSNLTLNQSCKLDEATPCLNGRIHILQAQQHAYKEENQERCWYGKIRGRVQVTGRRAA